KWGMYPEYTFGDEKKNAAFRHCAGTEVGGFGWIVGVGIDNKDIYKTVYDLRSLLLRATLVVLGAVILWTVSMARRTTRPIVELESHTRRVAAGDLDARIQVRSEDELGQLGHAFNEMTAELEQSRAQAVQIEKEAAWREMARQVAHEIKNPLTPIQLSSNLLLRARREDSPEFDGILERTVDMISRQVESMREIASDFAAFAGVRQVELEDMDLTDLTLEILTLTAAWADELKVEIDRRGSLLDGSQAVVRADRGELRRVLLNLVNNALEAMPDGGELCVDVHSSTPPGSVLIEISDTGEGLTEEARARLFEPYFTTRSRGTGLGLAICKRVVDELGGTIGLEPRAKGTGTVVRVELPAAQVDQEA
ncbi:MAG: ATP-binding protein, partial [Planctomycetota bacterium]